MAQIPTTIRKARFWRAPPLAANSIRALAGRLAVAHAALVGVLGLSAVLEFNRLSQNGFANNYYSAAVKSMLASWHNFVFLAFDRGGLESVDKPPIGLWIQTASAKLFGFSSLSLLIPEAAAAVLACGALYLVVSRRFGPWAGVASALILAVFPSFLAISRDNDPDVFLILFMILACGAALRSIETGRLRWLLCSAVLLGLAFNTKTLAAYLAVPGIAVAYLVWAPSRPLARTARLIGAGLLLGAVSVAWLAFVDLTPAHQRPFVGSSTDNSEFGLTLNYNGVGRVGGEVGGPGQIPHVSSSPRVPGVPGRGHGRGRPGARLRARGHARGELQRRAAPPVSSAPVPQVPPPQSSGNPPDSLPVHGRIKHPIAFSGSTGPLRLFNGALGDQGAWLLPLALVGLLAAALGIGTARDRRWPALTVLGGWFLVEAGVLSFSEGIVHPYYVSALGPGVAAMAGIGMVALAGHVRRSRWRAGLAVVAYGATVAVQLILMDREHYLASYRPYLIGAAAVAALLLVAVPSRWAGAAAAAGLGVLVAVPVAYATTVWDGPVEGTFPTVGPHQAYGPGGVGLPRTSLGTNLSLIKYLRGHNPTERWPVLTDASSTSASLILLGVNAGALGGYSGTDPSLDGPALARLVRRGEARYVLLGGAYATRGGNLATAAVARDCRAVPQRSWRPPGPRILAGPPTPGTLPPPQVTAPSPAPGPGPGVRRTRVRAQRLLAPATAPAGRRLAVVAARASKRAGQRAARRARAAARAARRGMGIPGTVAGPAGPGQLRIRGHVGGGVPRGPQGPAGLRLPATGLGMGIPGPRGPAGLGLSATAGLSSGRDIPGPRGPAGLGLPASAGVAGSPPGSTPIYVLTLYDCAGRANLLAQAPAGNVPIPF